MAYMSQQKKKELAPAIKAVLKKYGMKGTLAVNNHSTLVVNIKSGRLDLPENVNPYWVVQWERDKGNEEIANFFEELLNAMKGEGTGWFDESDIMTDYFHTAWYVDINVGKWNQPYVLEA